MGDACRLAGREGLAERSNILSVISQARSLPGFILLPCDEDASRSEAIQAFWHVSTAAWCRTTLVGDCRLLPPPFAAKSLCEILVHRNKVGSIGSSGILHGTARRRADLGGSHAM